MGDLCCTFFGHRDAPGEIRPKLHDVLFDLIENEGVARFYVGNQGNFDAMVYGVLGELQKTHDIRVDIVLAYLPVKKDLVCEHAPTILPEGIETVPRRFAIEYRNKWMIEQSDIVVTYVRRSFGGAAKFKALAERKGKTVISLFCCCPDKTEVSLP